MRFWLALGGAVLASAAWALDGGHARPDGGGTPVDDAALVLDLEFFQNLDAAKDLDLLRELGKD